MQQTDIPGQSISKDLSASIAHDLWQNNQDAIVVLGLNSGGLNLNPAAESVMSRLEPESPPVQTARELMDFIINQNLPENAPPPHPAIKYYGFWFEVKLSQPQPDKLMAVLRDISEKVALKSQCERLKEANTELNHMFELSDDGLVSVDPNGLILRMNRAYKTMVGIEDDHFVGKPASLVVEEGYLPQGVTGLVLKERKKKSIMVSLKGKEILITGLPVLNEQGRLVQIVTNIRDMSMLNKLGNELQKYHELTNRYETELHHLRAKQVESELVGRSLGAQRMMDLAAKASEVDSTVLIQGETGTGKELLVKTIHKLSKYRDGPLIALNCSSIPEALIESELFGYEAGAFTGSSAKGKAGLFEAAHGGTLFLDEISEMPLSMQAKLLRVIQDKKIRRIGANREVEVKVRIIGASNKNLKTLIEKNRFRSDLYYRLNIINIDIPPLRERKEDIPLLIHHFLDKFNKKFNRHKNLSNKEVTSFIKYDWPGNIRELVNAVERCVVLDNVSAFETVPLPVSISNVETVNCLRTYMQEMEYAIISSAYKKYQSTRKTAEALNVSQSSIVRKMMQYKKEHGPEA